MSASPSTVRRLAERAANGLPVGLEAGKTGRGVGTSRTPHAVGGPFVVTLYASGWAALQSRTFQPSEVEEAVAYMTSWIRDGVKP